MKKCLTIIGTEGKNEFSLHQDLDFSTELFLAHRDISILKRIDAICVEPVFIGGHQDGCISSDSYQRLLRKFPTSTEVNHYAGARVAACIREDIDTARDLEETYNQYMNRKVVATGSKLLSIFAAAELAKYQTISQATQAHVGE